MSTRNPFDRPEYDSSEHEAFEPVKAPLESRQPPSPFGGDEPAWSGRTSSDERTWGMAVHLSALSGFLIPFGNVIAPLVIWMLQEDKSRFVDDQGKESLNFQITVTIASLVDALTFCIGIGVVLLPLVLVASLVMVIIAGVSASQGIAYRYPFNIRLIN
jgi:hypothetical protein